MKKLFIIICGLLFTMGHSQSTFYEFYVELDNYENAPEFVKDGELLTYVGKDEKEAAFFSNYEILEFYQAFPSSKRQRTLNVFQVKTLNEDLMNNLTADFPSKYISAEDLTGRIFELLSTPNDYDIGNPAANYGFNYNNEHLKYIGTPEAWDYTYGDSNILIGISDSHIDTTDIDFKYKTTHATGYISTTYTMNNTNGWHGTATAGHAAAQGNNGHGITGVCSDCSILASYYTYNNLLNLAYEGADIINMSWAYLHTAPITFEQWIFDEIHDLGIVMFAGAGNTNVWTGNPSTGILYGYPASYDHVISVTSVNHKNELGEEVVIDATYGPMSLFVKDMLHHAVAINTMTSPYRTSHTNNDKVDLCAPGIDVFQYPWFVLNNTLDGQPLYYGWGTSASSPLVAGTAGLMLSINNCLTPDEVEDVLMLSAKNIEALAGNEPFIGRTGAGKLETGDAVEFTYEMANTSGNALIDGHDFYRFIFDLHHINNKLTISNQKFRDACVARFTAKNEIDILPGTDFKPNQDGLVDLIADQNVDITCNSSNRMAYKRARENNKSTETLQTKTLLSPSPNDGNFMLQLDKERKNVLINVYDIYGKVIYKDIINDVSTIINLPNIASGLYVVKLSSENYSETIKFIKK